MSNFKNEFAKFINEGDIRENIINWYDFKPESNILFIGDDIYKYILKNNKVTILESNKEKYENIACKEAKEIINATIEYIIEKDKKYDYIVVSSAIERIEDFINKDMNSGINNLQYFLDKAYKLLSDDGVMLFHIENKFSIKNFSGAKVRSGNSYDTILGNYKGSGIYSKNEITKIIQQTRMKFCRFYYPFPDHKLPSVIYSDEYLPTGNNSKLSYLIYYNPDDTIIFNELEAVREICRDGMLSYFSNSYFIELSNSDKYLSKVKFASFNNFRNKENKLITKMYKEYIEKVPMYIEGEKHIQNIGENIELLRKCKIDVADKIEEGKVISKFQTLKTLDEVINEYILDNRIDLAIELIFKWYKKIKSSFMCIFCEKSALNSTIFEKNGIIIKAENKEKLTFLEKGLYDLIFENIFVELDENLEFKKFIAYDQEWCEDKLPIEFILYRAINNLYEKNKKIYKYMNKDELYEKFEILEFVEEFKELENKIQHELLDKNISEMYNKTYSSLTTLEGINSIIENEKGKYERLVESCNKTNLKWQEEYDNINKALNEYRKKDIVYKIRNKLKK